MKIRCQNVRSKGIRCYEASDSVIDHRLLPQNLHETKYQKDHLISESCWWDLWEFWRHCASFSLISSQEGGFHPWDWAAIKDSSPGLRASCPALSEPSADKIYYFHINLPGFAIGRHPDVHDRMYHSSQIQGQEWWLQFRANTRWSIQNMFWDSSASHIKVS
jgi:hypothetical protein